MSGWGLAVAGVSIGLGIGLGLNALGTGVREGLGDVREGLGYVRAGLADVGTGVFRMAREDRQQVNKRLSALESKTAIAASPRCGNTHADACSNTARCVSSLATLVVHLNKLVQCLQDTRLSSSIASCCEQGLFRVI